MTVRQFRPIAGYILNISTAFIHYYAAMLGLSKRYFSVKCGMHFEVEKVS